MVKSPFVVNLLLFVSLCDTDDCCVLEASRWAPSAKMRKNEEDNLFVYSSVDVNDAICKVKVLDKMKYNGQAFVQLLFCNACDWN